MAGQSCPRAYSCYIPLIASVLSSPSRVFALHDILSPLLWSCSNYATMRFEPEAKHGANNGLNVARELLEDVKKEFPWISYGDLWTLGGVAAIQELGGPKIPWRPGRIDGFAAQCTPDGRLPDAAQGADHVRNVSTICWPCYRFILTDVRRARWPDLLPHGVRDVSAS